jgi:hypothetical protein
VEAGSVDGAGVELHSGGKQSASIEASSCLPVAFCCRSRLVSFSICSVSLSSRFHGVLAPNVKLRAAVIPQPARKDSALAHEHTHGQAAPIRWARLRKRGFHIDVERCACGGQLKILAAIEEPVVIVRFLTHLGLAARAPPRAAAREFSFDARVCVGALSMAAKIRSPASLHPTLFQQSHITRFDPPNCQTSLSGCFSRPLQLVGSSGMIKISDKPL